MLGTMNKVLAEVVPLYGPGNDRNIVVKSTITEKISKIGKIAIPVILFIIGLVVILSKKITRKVKVILISILVILAILGYVLMNYIVTIF